MLPNSAITDLVLQHGWGFDSSCWKEWPVLLDKNDLQAQLHVLDRGYFRTEKLFIASKLSRPSIVVTHSFGLHLLNDEKIQNCGLLVVISGFASFHNEENKSSRKAIKRMLNSLRTDSNKVLSDFYSNCYGNIQAPAAMASSAAIPNCDLELLSSDLQRLNDCQLDTDKFKSIKSILILHGSEDKIVPVSLARDLCKKLSNSELKVHANVGHALPFVEPQWCIEQILKTVHRRPLLLTGQSVE